MEFPLRIQRLSRISDARILVPCGLRGSDDDDEELCLPFCPIARFSRGVGQISVTSESIGIIDRYLSPRME